MLASEVYNGSFEPGIFSVAMLSFFPACYGVTWIVLDARALDFVGLFEQTILELRRRLRLITTSS